MRIMLTSTIKKVFWVYLLVLAPMWIVFVINNGFLMGTLNSHGVPPRELSLSALIGIFVSWMLHADLNHIKGNSLILFQTLILLALLEKSPLKLIVALIAGSGFATWCLGGSNSVHVGASGLVFAVFGYVFGAGIFGRRYVYLAVLLLIGTEYWFTLKEGLIPKDGVSFAAHFGGFIAGIALGYVFGYEKKKTFKYDKTFKQKYNDFIWNVKYKIKKLKR